MQVTMAVVVLQEDVVDLVEISQMIGKGKDLKREKMMKMKMMIEIVTVIMIMVAVVAVGAVMVILVAVALISNSLDFLLEHLLNVKNMFKNLLLVFVSMQTFIKIMFL